MAVVPVSYTHLKDPYRKEESMTEYEFESALMQRHGIENQQKISQASVGIAGLGGLGSNIAFFWHVAELENWYWWILTP